MGGWLSYLRMTRSIEYSAFVSDASKKEEYFDISDANKSIMK
jgi:hypothetical protein